MYQTRILLITPYFYPHKGGSQAYAEELHYHLMKLDPTVKVDVLCYNTDNAPEVEEYRGFTIYRVPCIEILKGQFALPNYIALWNTLNKLFTKNHYTFINSHTRFFESSWWVPLIARYFHTKAVLTDHCAYHPVHSSALVTRVTTLVDNYLVPFISKGYDLVTTTNQATQQFLYQLGITNTQLIYGGVDTRVFTPRKRTGKRILPGMNKSLSQRALLITFVGRMIPSKGPQILFQVAQQLTKQYPHVYFSFAGNGPQYHKLAKQSTNRIFFLGAQDRSRVARLMANSDILVHPSLHHEGFPNVLLEAASSGCAVIATNQGGTYEIIENNQTGLLIKPTSKSIKKALTTLIEDKKMRMRLAHQAREFVVNRYDWRKIARRYHTLIQQDIKRQLAITTLPTNLSLRKSLNS